MARRRRSVGASASARLPPPQYQKALWQTTRHARALWRRAHVGLFIVLCAVCACAMYRTRVLCWRCRIFIYTCISCILQQRVHPRSKVHGPREGALPLGCSSSQTPRTGSPRRYCALLTEAGTGSHLAVIVRCCIRHR